MERTASGAVVSHSPQATLELGHALGELAAPGDVVALTGPLGAGKTVFAKGAAEGLGVTSVVNSPTFILMNEHLGRLRLFHVDAYRLDDADEAAAAGILDDRHASGVTVIEWADRIAPLLPAERLDVSIEPRGEARVIRLEPHGARHEDIARALAARAERDLMAAR